MEYLVKAGLTKEETKAFKGRCLTPQSFGRVVFKKGDIVDGDEYYVKKAVEAGATAGEIIQSEASKKAKAAEVVAAKAKKAADKKAADDKAKLDADKKAEEDKKA